MEEAIRLHTPADRARPAQILQLGTTPKLASMRLPHGAKLLAADTSVAFIRSIWPGDIPSRRWAIQADWHALPVRDETCDVIVGDGSFNCLRYPDGFRTDPAKEAFARLMAQPLQP